jgi:anti-sigma regulatory factor (Ser/Thr protein kinase)
MTALAPAGASVPVPPARHGHCLGSSAIRDVMMLPSQPSALPAARAHAQRILSEWGLGPQLSEYVALCLSELVTNAIQASAVLRPVAPPVHVGLVHERRWLLLAVADASPRFPLLLSADRDAVSGRGLAIVEALSTNWGWHPAGWPGLVKVVWAEWARD